MRFGEFELEIISDGRFWLDGGAMFGVIPKALWRKVADVDELNRIPLGLNCLLVRAGEKNILVDTGCGDKYSEKEFQIYGIDRSTDIREALEGRGISPKEIDVVINTHLHFDHCGGNTVRQEGQLVPAFPNAEYVINAQEYKDANDPSSRSRASYFAENWLPLEDSGQIKLVTGDLEISPGVSVVQTPGHTLGHQSVEITAGDRKLFYFGDLCPTSAHVPLPWIMSYDLFPLTTLETRERIYPRAVEEEWLVVFEHEPDNPVGCIREDRGKYFADNAEWNTDIEE